MSGRHSLRAFLRAVKPLRMEYYKSSLHSGLFSLSLAFRATTGVGAPHGWRKDTK